MSDLDGREAAFEAKFAHDEDLKFKIEARGCKLVGLWAAKKLGIVDSSNAEAYAKEVVISNLEEAGFDDVKRKLTGDFENKELEVVEQDIDTQLVACMAEAKKQIMEETE